MEIIKFRALSEGKIYDCHACNFEASTALLDIKGWNNPQWCSVEKFLQFTTITDKNNKEIFEGDWVRQQFIGGDGQNEVPLDDMIFEGIVLWDYSGWGIDSMGNGEAEVGLINETILEVLGNKFEKGE